MQHPAPSSRVRRAVRAAAVVPALAVLAAGSPALAAQPEGWEPTDNGSALQAILVLGGIPVLLFVTIWLLAALPSIIKGQQYSSELAFREPEWFGGPRQGADAVAAPSGAHEGRGGASADW